MFRRPIILLWRACNLGRHAYNFYRCAYDLDRLAYSFGRRAYGLDRRAYNLAINNQLVETGCEVKIYYLNKFGKVWPRPVTNICMPTLKTTNAISLLIIILPVEPIFLKT
jgi:hypothetical protein